MQEKKHKKFRAAESAAGKRLLRRFGAALILAKGCSRAAYRRNQISHVADRRSVVRDAMMSMAIDAGLSFIRHRLPLDFSYLLRKNAPHLNGTIGSSARAAARPAARVCFGARMMKGGRKCRTSGLRLG